MIQLKSYLHSTLSNRKYFNQSKLPLFYKWPLKIKFDQENDNSATYI